MLDDGTEIAAGHVLSSAGWNETMRLTRQSENAQPVSQTDAVSGKMTFVESISVLDRLPRDLDFDDTIVFYNDHDRFDYSRPDDLADVRSGIVCSPNNYRYDAARRVSRPEKSILPRE